MPSNGKLALLGPNGAGKTTLFSLLTCLLRQSAGSISIFGHDVTTSPGAALAQLGVVFQQPTLDLDLSLSQNLAYHGAIDSDSNWHPDSIKGARNHVRAVLADMIAGRSVEVSKTRAYGCSVKYGS